MGSRRFLGLQVKTSGWDAAHTEERFYLRRSSFRPASSTFICVLGWSREGRRFADDCLLLPSLDAKDVMRIEGEWLVLELEPGARSHRLVDRYRVELRDLGARVESMLA
jgi:hypothetical protein